VEYWHKNPLVIAVAGAALGLIGNVVVAYVNAVTSARADQRKACYEMIHQSIGRDAQRSMTNLRFLRDVGLLSRCGDIKLDDVLKSSSALPVQEAATASPSP
jgi:hypothetical protein